MGRKLTIYFSTREFENSSQKIADWIGDPQPEIGPTMSQLSVYDLNDTKSFLDRMYNDNMEVWKDIQMIFLDDEIIYNKQVMVTSVDPIS